MNRWEFLLSWATLFGFLCSMALASLGVRQRSVDCGPHPLIALAAASRPFASTTATFNDLIRAVRADPDIWSEMQILLQRYDDCIRAGDGLHYKRSKPDSLEKEQFPFSGLLHSPPNREDGADGGAGNVPEF